MRQAFRLLAVLSVLVVAGCAEAPSQGDAAGEAIGSPSADVVGSVSFPVSCDAAVQQDFDRAVAMLHSFEFEEARNGFTAIAGEDPDCAMAHWGIAMSHYHPLWAPPRPDELEAGAAAVAAARSMEATEREADYIEAIGAFFDGYQELPHRARAMAYEKAMAVTHENHPDDPEARILYALAVLSGYDPTDKSYAVQERVGAMLEPMFEEMPDHPGLAHYIIHSYDFPPLAERAVEAAHRYLDIAQSMPHALHMSGHIFTQLAMWEESIDANRRSAEAARDRGARLGVMQAQMNELHALDYLVYAHLQRGENEEAAAILAEMDQMEDLSWETFVVAYNTGAPPARYALERRAWEEAADLPPLTAAEEAGGGPVTRTTVALRYWARALGAARSGRLEQAAADADRVAEVAAELQSSDDVWARNTSEVLRLSAASWLALARGDAEQALDLMARATELEDQTDKSGISPGRILPAHEQYGDMLLELDRPQEALAEYEESMRHAQGRFNTYLGAARAAAAMGDREKAAGYYGELLELAVPDAGRAELEEAREFV